MLKQFKIRKIMELEAGHFYKRFQQAPTSSEREKVASEFQTFYNELSETERV